MDKNLKIIEMQRDKILELTQIIEDLLIANAELCEACNSIYSLSEQRQELLSNIHSIVINTVSNN